MQGLEWLIAAALATQPTGSGSFPCEKLGNGLLQVYDSFKAPAAAPAPVQVKKKAVLYQQAAPLLARTFAIGEGAISGAERLVFSPYRSGSQSLFCTRGRSDALFGAGDEASQFLVRCLADRDGNGTYESFTRRGPLVRADRMPRTLPAASEAPEDSALLPLSRPLTLVEKPGLIDPATSLMQPRALTRITVSALHGNQVELKFSGQLTSVPDHVAGMFGMASQEAVYMLPMTAGATVPVGGTRIRFDKSGSRWTATVLDGFGPAPALRCGGTVAEVGDTFTVLGAGGQAIIARASLPTEN